MQTLNAEKACNKGQKALGGRAGLNALLAAALLGTLPAMADDLSIPTLKDNSAYTLTKVDAAGENTITKFEYNIETGNLTPVYYRVDLKETTYGDGDASKYYTWTQDSEGHNQFIETTDIDALIQAKYDTSNPQNRFENKEDLSSVNGNFINQNNTAATDTSAYGGAIRNSSGTIGEINGDFVGNYVTSNISSFGGAISGGTYGDITGDFIGNYALTTEYNPSTQIRGAHGGAINQANTGNIVGNFIGNHASSESYATGGAIYNATGYTIGDITGDFIGNYAEGKVEGVSGGAIHNYGSTIGDITGNFIGNYATNVEGGAGGGAINNYWRSEIGDITGDFIGNYAKSVNGSANGGAIAMMHNGNKLNNITGDFIGNYAESETNLAQGGAIYNWSFLQRENEGAKSINSIKGDFISNYAKGNEVEGGAFYNNSITGDITGNFINNAAISTTTEDNELLSSSFAQGGAIYNESSEGELGHITGDFVANYAIGKYAYGGAINNRGDMDGVTGNFIDNYIQSKELAYGGGIYNTGEINNITGNFSGNSAAVVESLESTAENSGSSTLGMYGGSTFPGVEGGAIYNTGVIKDINGDFTKNSAYTTAQGLLVRGGAISNNGRINKITGNFIENSVYLNTSQTNEEISTYILSENPSYSILAAEGGAIANDNEIELINSDFVKNSTTSEDENVIAQGGAISNSTFGTIHDLQSNFLENKATGNLVTGGAIYNEGIIENITGTFQNNSVNGDTMAFGGAISNRGTIGTYGDNTISLAVLKGTIINEATGESITLYNIQSDASETLPEIIDAVKNDGYKIIPSEYEFSQEVTQDEWDTIMQEFQGGVDSGLVFVDNPLNNFSGDDFAKPTGGIVNSSFIGNSAVSSNGIAKGGAIYSTSNLNIEADNYQSVFSGNFVEYTDENGDLIHDDNAIFIDNKEATLSFKLKNKGSVVLKDNIDGLSGYNVDISGDNIDNTVFFLHNDIRNADVSVNNTTINTINDDVHVYDFNSFTVSGDTKLVADVDLKNHEMDRITADSYGEHSGNINVIGMNLLSDANEDEEITEVFFAETGLMDNVTNGTGELPDAYQTAYTPIYKYKVDYETREDDGGYFLFQKAGANSSNPSDNFNEAVLSTPVANLAAGQAAINEAFKYVFEHADAFTQLPSMERYAKINANKYALSTDFNNNMPDYSTYPDKGVWFRPYTTFESMNLKNGPDVDAITYGSLVGFDGDFKEMKNGWHRVFTGYAGYMGSSLNYSGVDTTMNGGLLGFTETFYKGNFWTAITASAGASVGESHSMYGKEDYTSLLAGVGSKTGYNFEFKDGKFIIQPIMFLSYTFVNTFDYKNAAGVNIESDPLHTIQLNPSVRFIANLKNGWQPYASVGMVWNLMNESKVTANNVKLPEMSVKPYVEYGVGIQRNWAEKYTGFLQAMIRNGGRNGIALTGGFRSMIGDEKDNNNEDKPKKVIKAL